MRTNRHHQPRTSIVLPVYNGEIHIGAALESLTTQTDPDYELIIIDDGSTDQTPALLKAAGRRDSRLKLIHQPHTGIVAALNRGLAEATGRYVARMDADDLSHPDRLRLQSEYLDTNPGIGLIGSQVEYLGDAAVNQGLARFVDWNNTLTEPDEIDICRFVESPLIHPSVMFRCELPGQHGAYRDGPFPEDYELWLRWLEHGVRMAKLEQPLLRWRESPGRLTRTDSRYSVEAFYETKSHYLYRWLERNNPHHPRVIVWGSGRTSRKRLRTLTDLGLRIDAYVDIDPRKIGYRIGGAEVIAPGSLPDPGQCFVLQWVASRGARAEIEDALRQRGHQRGRHYLPCA